MPQYWFGYATAFSGQVMYEPIIYQGYNIAFTAFPIMWFAMFDEQLTKSTFLNEPKHYWIGLCNEYFSFKQLTGTVLKGIVSGLFIYLYVFHTLNGYRISSDGSADSFWLSSAVLYGVVVVDANVWVLQRTNSHTWWSTFFISASILSYFIIFWLESLFPWSTYMYRIFDDTMGDSRVWLVIFLAVWQFMALDMLIARWSERRAEKRQKAMIDQVFRSKSLRSQLRSSIDLDDPKMKNELMPSGEY